MLRLQVFLFLLNTHVAFAQSDYRYSDSALSPITNRVKQGVSVIQRKIDVARANANDPVGRSVIIKSDTVKGSREDYLGPWRDVEDFEIYEIGNVREMYDIFSPSSLPVEYLFLSGHSTHLEKGSSAYGSLTAMGNSGLIFSNHGFYSFQGEEMRLEEFSLKIPFTPGAVIILNGCNVLPTWKKQKGSMDILDYVRAIRNSFKIDHGWIYGNHTVAIASSGPFRSSIFSPLSTGSHRNVDITDRVALPLSLPILFVDSQIEGKGYLYGFSGDQWILLRTERGYVGGPRVEKRGQVLLDYGGFTLP